MQRHDVKQNHQASDYLRGMAGVEIKDPKRKPVVSRVFLENVSPAKPEDLNLDALSFDLKFNVPMLPTIVGQSFIGAFHLDSGSLVVRESSCRPPGRSF